VLLAEGMVSRHVDHFVLEEKVGPVPIRVELGPRPLIWLRTPPIEYGKTFEPAACADDPGRIRGRKQTEEGRLSAGASEIAEGLVISSRFNHSVLVEMTVLTAHPDDVVPVAVSRHKGWFDRGAVADSVAAR
jgi:hypothetical protein